MSLPGGTVRYLIPHTMACLGMPDSYRVGRFYLGDGGPALSSEPCNKAGTLPQLWDQATDRASRGVSIRPQCHQRVHSRSSDCGDKTRQHRCGAECEDGGDECDWVASVEVDQVTL